MNQEERIKKIKVKIQKAHSFWYFLLMNMKLESDEGIPTMCVNGRGDLKYNPDFLEKLSDEEVLGCLLHETFHVVMNHVERLQGRDQMIWNIAVDIATNHILLNNGFSIPEKGIYPKDNQVEVIGYVVKDINQKTPEKIYTELLKKADTQKIKTCGAGFDEHDYSKTKSDKEKKKWQRNIKSAEVLGNSFGNMPKGIQSETDEVCLEKINWKRLLQQFVSQAIVSDLTYRRPSKKSVSCGFYMPSQVKESINVTLAIDTSGSISSQDYAEFMGEIATILNSFSSVEGEVLYWDTHVEKVKNISSNEVSKEYLSRDGYGGTDASCVKEYLDKKQSKPNILIYLTDGYFDTPSLPDCKRLWVLTKDGTDEVIKGETCVKIK